MKASSLVARPRRIGREVGPSEPSAAAIAALLAAALRSGMDLLGALAATAAACPEGGAKAAALADAAAALRVGLPWAEAWRGCPASLTPIQAALRPTWERGSSPVGVLETVADGIVQQASMRGQRAAAELGVRLTLPVTLLLLPAFITVGVLPLLLALAGAVMADLPAGP